MTAAPEPDVVHLVALIEAAKAEAGRLGVVGHVVAADLEAALASARGQLGRGGRPDEGLRPDDLTTANDK